MKSNKSQLRQKFLEIRASLSDEYISSSHSKISVEFISWIEKRLSKELIVAGYWPKTYELNVELILKQLNIMQIKCALPIMKRQLHQQMQFVRWQYGEPLVKNKYCDIHEPNTISQIKQCKELATMPIKLGEELKHTAMFKSGNWYNISKNHEECFPNVFITPLVVCDRKFNRVGYGKGFYDKYFNKLKSQSTNFISVGLCYEKQISEEDINREAHDIKLDVIITEKGIMQNERSHNKK